MASKEKQSQFISRQLEAAERAFEIHKSSEHKVPYFGKENPSCDKCKSIKNDLRELHELNTNPQN